MGTAHPRHHAVHVARGDARSSPDALALDAKRAVVALGLGAAELARVIDVDASTAGAIIAGSARLAPGTDAANRLLLLIRLHRGLGDVYGSTDHMDRWLDAEDPALEARPRTLIRTFDGLRRVVANVERRCKDCLW